MPPSSLGSSEEEEEERCEKAELRSEAVCTGLLLAPAAGGAGGCGLHRPVRLSRGTGVMDAEVTSLVLVWGFTWFLLEEEEEDQRKVTTV